MTPMTRKFTASAAALALIISACGETEQASGATTPEPTMPPETTTTTTTADSMSDMDGMAEDDTMSDEVAPMPFLELQIAAEALGNNGNAAVLAAGLDEALGLEGSIGSPAARTYATLATLLQEHVYLAGIAIDIGLEMGLDSAAFAQAADILDGNSVELAGVIGSVAGDENQAAFLDLWRQHIGFFVDYTAASAASDADAQEQALLNLGSYGEAAGAFFEEITAGELPSSATQESLAGHIDTLTAAIDAAVAGDDSVFAQLKAAAHHVGVAGSARAIAGAVVAATGMEGSVESPAAVTLATLSTLLEEHAYLAGIAVKTAYSSGLESDTFAAAAAVLDENSVALADLIGSIDAESRQPFLDLWRDHVGFFVDYAVGALTEDAALVEQAKLDLGSYGESAGAFFEALSGGVIESNTVQTGLGVHIDTLGQAIESLAAVYR
jgi:hypothetical protein